MIMIAIITAAFASAINAVSSVLQRLAAGTPAPNEIFSREFTARVTSHRKFIIGLVLQIGAFLLQAVALKFGPLAVVTPAMTLDLVFLLFILKFKFNIAIGLREWLAVLGICGGLGLLFTAGHPRSGSYEYSIVSWIIAISLIATMIVGAALIVRRNTSPPIRAALTGLAASGTYALNSISVKLAIQMFHNDGLVHLLASWPIYTLIVSGISSLFLMQNMYGAGPLAISQPVIEIGEPAISVTIGVTVFGETLQTTAPALLFESIGVLLLAWGVVILSRSDKIHEASQKGI